MGFAMSEHVTHFTAASHDEGMILAILRASASRAATMGSNLFSDPAWDIVLMLFLGHLRQQPVSLRHLAERSGLSAASVARWINALQTDGLVEEGSISSERVEDLVELSAKGLMGMRRWLSSSVKACCSSETVEEVEDLLGRMLGNDL